MVFAHIQLFRRRGRCNDSCAQRFANFNRRQTHTTGRAEHQQGFAFLKLTAIHQRVIACRIGHDEGGCGDKIHTFRHRDNCRGISADLFGKGAPAGKGDHAVTGFNVLDTFAHALYNTSAFATGRERQLGFELIQVLNNQGIGKVNSRSFYFQHHLAFRSFQVCHFFDDQLLWQTVLFTQ